MSLASEIEIVIKRLDQQLTCTHVVVEAVKQLIDMYAREPADIRRAVDLHNYLTLQFARYHARQIGRTQLVSSLEAAKEVSRLLTEA